MTKKENISFQFFITVYEIFIEEYYKKEKKLMNLNSNQLFYLYNIQFPKYK